MAVIQSPTYAAQTDIELWVVDTQFAPGEFDASRAWLEQWKDQFNASNPDIRLTAFPAAISEETVAVRIAAGNPPDIVHISSNVLSRWIAGDLLGGLLLPLDRYFERSRLRNAFIPDVIDMARYGEHILGMPYALQIIFMTRNLDVYDRSGVAEPQTWEEHVGVTRRLTQYGSEGQVLQWGHGWSVSAAAIVYWLDLGLRQLGYADGMIPQTAGQARIFHDDSIKTLSYLFDLWSLGPQLVSQGRSGNNFIAGRTAEVMGFANAVPQFQQMLERGDNVVFRRLPGPGPDTDGVWINPWVYSILSSTKHPDEAWRVLEDLTSAQANKDYLMTAHQVLPVHRAHLTDRDILSRPMTKELIEILYTPMYNYGPKHILMTSWHTLTGQPLLQALNKEMGMETALEVAQETLNTRLRQLMGE